MDALVWIQLIVIHVALRRTCTSSQTATVLLIALQHTIKILQLESVSVALPIVTPVQVTPSAQLAYLATIFGQIISAIIHVLPPPIAAEIYAKHVPQIVTSAQIEQPVRPVRLDTLCHKLTIFVTFPAQPQLP